MEYRNLGKSEIKVSSICLGTMTFGQQNTQEQAHQQLDYSFDQGVNFVDTAEMYPVPPMEETYTKTEQIIGNWDKLHSQRDKIILATKAVSKSEAFPYVRDGRPLLDRKNLEAAVDASLERLKVDYIDLYQLHWPERQTNFFGQLGYEHNPEDQSTSIEETLSVLGDIQKAGKVRHFGLSNDTPWGIMKNVELAENKNLPRVVSVQNPYSLLNRTFEVGLAEVAHREQVGLLAYSPMAFGVLSGKYLGGKKPAGARLTLWDRFSRYTNPRATKATEAYVALAQKYNIDPAQMSLAYVTSRSFVTSNIIGATTMEQLQANIASADLALPKELLAEIESVHQQNPNPAP